MGSKREKLGIVGQIFGLIGEDNKCSAERAWIHTTYGNNAYRTLEKRIADKQDAIRKRIDGKLCDGQPVSDIYNSYFCFVRIEEDLIGSVDLVFEPFIEGGFVIVNVSEKIEELAKDNIYLISWKKAFQKDSSQEHLISEEESCLPTE